MAWKWGITQRDGKKYAQWDIYYDWFNRKNDRTWWANCGWKFRRNNVNARFCLEEIFIQGVWKNNSTLVQLLGLCPLLAVSSYCDECIGFKPCNYVGFNLYKYCCFAFRKQIPHEIRIPIYVMIIATTVTVVQLLMNAYTHTLYQALGIFIPLIVTNCI